jgi:STAS-like domain of unknown function (DUF4325)
MQMGKRGRLLLTKDTGRAIGARFPTGEVVELDFSGVEAASPSFLGELLRVARAKNVRLTPLNASARIAETWTRLGGQTASPAG